MVESRRSERDSCVSYLVHRQEGLNLGLADSLRQGEATDMIIFRAVDL